MADIQMCLEKSCQVKTDCYRYTAKPSEQQAYGPPAIDFDPKDGCDNYWPNGEKTPRQ